MKTYHAVDVHTTFSDFLLALVDDFRPTAVEERGDRVRIFFPTTGMRDAARAVLAARFDVTAIEVPDEDWARRSQQNLTPVTVGRLTIFPNPESRIPGPFSLVIQPSMGFGTGHHATTRLCLEALQTIDLTRAFMLDVGTGSGVLAIAADRLGASRALGIDHDPDAIQSARENLALNPAAFHVELEVGDLTTRALPEVDVMTANLTGALLIRSAAALLGAVRPGGSLIVSGLLVHERDEVCRAFEPARIIWEREDEGWVGLILQR